MADGAAAPGARALARAGLWAYAILTLFGAAGFFLMGRPMPFPMDPELQAKSFELGMKYTGAATVWAGWVAATAAAAARLGWRRGLLASVSLVAITLGVELVGAKTGFPFGEHGYGPELGWKVFGLIPFVIPLSWYLMTYACYAIALRYGAGRVGTLLLLAAGMFAWDVLMEPAMSKAYPFWHWRESGVWYGMPLANWITWLVVAPVLGLVLGQVAGADAERLRDDPAATWLFIWTGLMPLLMAVRFGLWVPALVGGGAMLAFLGLPALLGLRAGPGPAASGAPA